MHWKKVTLVGVGLLGGSLGLALRERRLAETVVGFVRRKASAKECERVGAVDVATLDLEVAVRGAGLVVLCTPVLQMHSLTERMLPALGQGAIVTDVGSVKHCVVRDLSRLLAGSGAHFVGGHPMAGSERAGVAAARSDLFVDAICVVAPVPASNPAAVRKVERLWESVGGRVLRLSPETHDRLVSRSSHLPQVLAACLANLVLSPMHGGDQRLLCANGFKDTTRIASGSPEMWRDILVANRENVVAALNDFSDRLREFKNVLKHGRTDRLSALLDNAKQLRDEWLMRTPVRSARVAGGKRTGTTAPPGSSTARRAS